MPLGFERLNARSQRPNAQINFIKAMEGPDKAIAEDYLNRIAAQCYPVMKAAHISVMSLEDFPPNNEFLGRNFNAGECIQLVLKNKQGHWLPFNFVQMVMMHELAHCKQMNHSKYFWQVRNQFSEEMRDLWRKHYHGEGLWGRGQELSTGGFVIEGDVDASDIPEHLCGGSYRRRGKRKRGATEAGKSLTYAERQQRRISKKFGRHGEGNELGEDELIRGALETGNRHAGKPRVANSKRGRELRARAALARFSAEKTRSEQQQTEETADPEETESEDDIDDAGIRAEVAGLNPTGYVNVCDEHGLDEEEEDAGREKDELRNISDAAAAKSIEPELPNKKTTSSEHDKTAKGTATKPRKTAAIGSIDMPTVVSQHAEPAVGAVNPTPGDHKTTSCKICSMENDVQALLCLACSNVLRPTMIKDVWKCQNKECQSTGYLNAGDVGRCGICAAPRPAKPTIPATAPGVINSDVLRWD